jgi:RimJ/RimL family protein N-acetyltransferase
MKTTLPVQEEPILNIAGEKVALGPLCRDLLPLYLKWDNDFAVLAPRGMPLRPKTWEAEETWYEGAGKREGEVMFTVYERATLRPLGVTMLLEISPVDRTATFGCFIGEKECWGRGCGTEATRLTLDYGFTGLGLHNIMLTVYSFNERAIRAYTRAGFRIIGRRRESGRLLGQVYDDVYMDCLATEFQSPILQRLLEPLPSP